MTDTLNIFTWLDANGYPDVAEKINAQKQKWSAQGLKTRRNWWEVLSGDKNGNSRVIDGLTFPVLAAAQKRQGKTVTDNALKLNDVEEAPGIKENNRWAKRADRDEPVEAKAEETAPVENNQPVAVASSVANSL